MKNIRKLLCVILSIAALLCCCVSASAAEPKAATVGVLTIFSSAGGGSSSFSTSGHAFLSFKNTSAQQIKIGGLNVNPGHEITIGAWGTKPADHELGYNEVWHSGICYNIESHLVNYDNGLSNRVSLTMGVTMNDVIKIRNVISNWGSYNYLTNNCATFAVKAWNSVASSNLQLSAKAIADQPTKLSKNIITKSGYQSNRYIMNITPIGYVNSNGSFVSITLNCQGGHDSTGGIHRSRPYNYTPDTLEVA